MPKEIKFKGIESSESPFERPIEINVGPGLPKNQTTSVASEEQIRNFIRNGERVKRQEPTDRDLSGRAVQRLKQRRVTARFFASILAILAIIVVWPAFVFLYHWNMEQMATPVPRWVFFSVFVAFLQIMYGLMLGWVPDWTVLRSVSWFLVALSCFYCLLAMAMAVGGNSGVLVRYLEVPDSLRSRGVIWLLAQVCLTVLVSLVTFREYWIWRRSEVLMQQLFPGPLKKTTEMVSLNMNVGEQGGGHD
jgi:hypothetical protein